jgi:hypothetical protein
MSGLRRIALERVHFMPKVLQPGVLYVSVTYGTAAHLCACGCGTKIRTPLGPTEWAVGATPTGQTLRPSVGNWQQPCRSHYLISAGEIVWAEPWRPCEVAQGRQRELRASISALSLSVLACEYNCTHQHLPPLLQD